MQTAKFIGRNAERFCCAHPVPVPQRLPWTPLITCPQPVEEKWARTYPGTGSWFHPSGAQKHKKGCREAEMAHLCGLAEGLLRKAGGRLSFCTPAEGLEQPTRRGMRKGMIRGPSCTVRNLPSSPGPASAYWGPMPNNIDSQTWLCLSVL